MKLRNPSLLRTSVVAAGLLLTATAFAQQKSPFYAGFGVGAAMTDGDYSGQVFSATPPVDPLNNGSRFGGRIYAGYQFTPQLAAELGYTDFGSRRSSYEVFGSTANYFVRGDFKASGVSLDLVGRLPVAKDLSLNARVGVMETSLKYSDSDGFSAPNTRQARLHLGVDGDGHQSEWAPELQPHFCGFAFRLLGHHRWQVRGVAHRGRNFC
jgi:OOP family OmpA-OmpF porin